MFDTGGLLSLSVSVFGFIVSPIHSIMAADEMGCSDGIMVARMLLVLYFVLYLCVVGWREIDRFSNHRSWG